AVGADEEPTPIWDPSRIAGRTHDTHGSVLMPTGIFCIGLFFACVVLFLQLPGPAAVVPVVAALLLAATVRRSILVEARERQDASDSLEALVPGREEAVAGDPTASTDVRPVVAAVLF